MIELPQWLSELFAFLLQVLPGGLWMAFWLWGVDWKKVWAALAEGAWVPCVLLVLIVAFVWARIDPTPCNCLGIVSLPNFWGKLGTVGALAGVAMFSGWLQGVLGYHAPEYAIDPPPAAQGHGHDHGHH